MNKAAEEREELAKLYFKQHQEHMDDKINDLKHMLKLHKIISRQFNTIAISGPIFFGIAIWGAITHDHVTNLIGCIAMIFLSIRSLLNSREFRKQ